MFRSRVRQPCGAGENTNFKNVSFSFAACTKIEVVSVLRTLNCDWMRSKAFRARELGGNIHRFLFTFFITELSSHRITLSPSIRYEFWNMRYVSGELKVVTPFMASKIFNLLSTHWSLMLHYSLLEFAASVGDFRKGGHTSTRRSTSLVLDYLFLSIFW